MLLRMLGVRMDGAAAPFTADAAKLLSDGIPKSDMLLHNVLWDTWVRLLLLL